MGKIEYFHNLLSCKELSCVELTEKYLCAIYRDNPQLSAFVSVSGEYALEAARSIDKKIALGEQIGILAGIPMSLKDNISTRGLKTTCCSKMLSNYIPVYDATVWSRLKAQGAILLGKNNMDEFAMGNTGEYSCIVPAVNPHDKTRVTGGSSSGSATAVAGNLSVYSLGSDTGGSVRQPAAFCGIAGLKPTYGAVSRYGLVAYASSLDQIGPMAQSVEDVSIVFDAISGADVLDSTCNRENKESTFSNLDNSVKGRTIGIIRQFSDKGHIDSSVKTALDEAVKTFESMGVNVVCIDMPDIEQAVAVYYVIACAEASSNLARFDGVRYGYRAQGDYQSIHELVCRSRSEAFGEEVKRRILMGTNVLSSDKCSYYYDKAKLLRQSLCRQFEKAFTLCDVIITPTTPTPAFEKNRTVASSTGLFADDVCTVPVNLASLPAISLPCGYTEKGIPVGMQIIGNKFEESLILNMAYKFQQATDYQRTVEWGVRL